jgi:hypothetical protein
MCPTSLGLADARSKAVADVRAESGSGYRKSAAYRQVTAPSRAAEFLSPTGRNMRFRENGRPVRGARANAHTVVPSSKAAHKVVCVKEVRFCISIGHRHPLPAAPIAMDKPPTKTGRARNCLVRVSLEPMILKIVWWHVRALTHR